MSMKLLSSPIASRTAAQARTSSGLCFRCRYRLYSRRALKEDDVVLLRKRGDERTSPILTRPLRPGAKIKVTRGTIRADDLIGKGIRDVIYSSKGIQYRIREPSLADYVTLSPRLVTPVYPADANLIVSLLDIHPQAASTAPGTNGPLEIFEAGTGHGALTLHLARAIHGLNPPAPLLPPTNVVQNAPVEVQAPENGDVLSSTLSPSLTEDHNEGLEDVEPVAEVSPENGDILTSSLPPAAAEDINKDSNYEALQKEYEAYLPTRRAVIHTLDISPTYSQHAQMTVRNFRHGIYYPDIDFHTGTIPGYLSSRLAFHPEPFLNHAILDLPGPHNFMELVAQALKLDGSLIVFSPSITQIMTCMQLVREKKLPLAVDTVLELGVGSGVGGREWDVRSVKPRALLKTEAEARKARIGDKSEDEAVSDDAGTVDELQGEGVDDQSRGSSDVLPDETDDAQSAGWEMVCRPKVGARVTGGGFLGVFRCVRR